MEKKTSRDFLCYLAFANFLLGAKLWLIGRFGNQTPFWDQWGVEGDGLYKPFLNGSLKFADLFKPDCENHILTTRLIELAELALNGIWNPLLQMAVNSVLHIAAIAVLVLLMVRVLGRAYLPALLSFSLYLFALPNGWESTLWAFQGPIYIVPLLSSIGLWWTTTREPFSRGWCFGLFFLVWAFFSYASGVFGAAATAGLGFFYYFSGLRRTHRQLLAALLLAGLFIAGVLFTPGAVSGTETVKAGSLAEFLNAMIHILAWPSPYLFMGLLQVLPAAVFALWMLRKRPPFSDARWFLISLLLWILGIEAAIAYGRAQVPLSSRYFDTFGILILLTFASLLALVRESTGSWKRLSIGVMVLWVAMVAACLQVFNAGNSQHSLKDWRETKKTEETNTRNYVATGDRKYLFNKPQFEIPYPVPELLVSYLDNPEIRRILPANIAPPDRVMKEGRFDGVVTFLLEHYYLFVGIGLLAAAAYAGLGWHFRDGHGVK